MNYCGIYCIENILWADKAHLVDKLRALIRLRLFHRLFSWKSVVNGANSAWSLTSLNVLSGLVLCSPNIRNINVNRTIKPIFLHIKELKSPHLTKWPMKVFVRLPQWSSAVANIANKSLFRWQCELLAGGFQSPNRAPWCYSHCSLQTLLSINTSPKLLIDRFLRYLTA